MFIGRFGPHTVYMEGGSGTMVDRDGEEAGTGNWVKMRGNHDQPLNQICNGYLLAKRKGTHYICHKLA